MWTSVTQKKTSPSVADHVKIATAIKFSDFFRVKYYPMRKSEMSIP